MSRITLNAEPGKVYSWEEFKRSKPAFSIGLDGFIDAGPKRDPTGPWANFDHHTEVDRIATRSTSDQVHMEINLGLFETFSDKGIPTANIYVNDPDEDTCLASWLLINHERVRNHADPMINRLVNCEDRLDVTAGAYPLGDTSMRRKMAWIFEPYAATRFAGQLKNLDSVRMISLMEAVHSRIDKYIINGGEELQLDGQYERIGGGNGWVMVKESGPASRMAMYNEGVRAFVALVSQSKDKSVYSIGRRSVWTPFPIEKLYFALNTAERAPISTSNMWNGSATIGGSPRATGSYLEPSEVIEIINKALS